MTKSLEDYLEAIYNLASKEKGASVRSVASRLGVKMPSVVKAVRELKGMGLVLQQPYGPVELTEEGLRLAYDVQKRHVLLRSFLEKLGVSTSNADHDACLMEHILCAETLDRIRSYMSEKKGQERKGQDQERKDQDK